MEFDPDTRFTLQLKLDPESEAAVPLHVTVATPETPSVSVPLIPIVDVPKAIVEPLAGELVLTTGYVLSRLTVTDALALYPPVSVTVPEMIWFGASELAVWDGGQL